MTMIKDQRSIL